MPFNGSGVFSRVYNWVTDRDNAIKVRADRMDAEFDGIATGLSNCITRDGQTTISANIPFNDKRITGLGDATADTDALNRRTGDGRYLELGGSGTMTGVLRASDGSATAPAYTFGSDTNAGFYRAGADDIRGAVNGADVLHMRTVGVNVTGAMAATGAVSGTTGTFSAAVSGTTGTFTGAITMQSRAVDAFPSGTLMLFQQTNAPTGWTKQTFFNDVALRVVSGTANAGGSFPFSNVFTARTIFQANLPNYTLPNTLALSGSQAGCLVRDQTEDRELANATGGTSFVQNMTWTTTTLSLTGSVTSGGSGTPMDFGVAYVDVIIAAKN